MMTPAEQFQHSGYAVLKNVINPEEADQLYQYTIKNLEKGNLDDGQVPGSPSFYQDKEVVQLQQRLKPQLECAINKTLLPVFNYHRIYRTGAVLRMHKDSTRAEISASINLGQKGDPWDLWLLDYDENPHRIILEPGDALIYNGLKLYHWRGKLTYSDYVSQIMFHFVDKKGQNTFAARMEWVRKIRKKIRQLWGMEY